MPSLNPDTALLHPIAYETGLDGIRARSKALDREGSMDIGSRTDRGPLDEDLDIGKSTTVPMILPVVAECCA